MNFRDLVCAGVGAETPKAVLPLPDLLTRLPSAGEEYLSQLSLPGRKSSGCGGLCALAWRETDYSCILTPRCSLPLAAPIFFQSPPRAPNKFRGDELVLSIYYLSNTVLGSLSRRLSCITRVQGQGWTLCSSLLHPLPSPLLTSGACFLLSIFPFNLQAGCTLGS